VHEGNLAEVIAKVKIIAHSKQELAYGNHTKNGGAHNFSSDDRSGVYGLKIRHNAFSAITHTAMIGHVR